MKQQEILATRACGTRNAVNGGMPRSAPFRSLVRFALVVTPVGLALACSPDADPPAASSLVVGLQGDELRTLLSEVTVSTKVDGKVAKEERITRDANGIIPFPRELVLEGAPGAKVEVEVVGTGTTFGSTASAELVRRRAVTVIPREKRLLRLALEGACVVAPGTSAAVCTGDTCRGGRCVSPDVPEAALEPYATDWPVNQPDICRPANAGAPEVVLGKGQTDYGNLTDGETLRLERGPQGGHHLWVALRMKNIKQAGTRTLITAVQPGTGLKATPAAFVFGFEPDEGGYCKLYGLRFQVDAGGALGEAHKPFLGKDLDITIEITDVAGRTARATKRVHVADKLLCPDGTEACNGS